MAKNHHRTMAVQKRFWSVLSLWVVFSLFLAACSPTSPVTLTATPAEPATPDTPPTATVEPSPTPQPGKLLLFAPAGSDLSTIQPLIAEQAVQAGLTVEPLTDLQTANLTADVRAVVMLAAPANVSELVAAAPQTPFVVVSAVDLPAAPNLSVIRQRPENQVFLAGFVAALLTTDWRIGGLVPSDGPLGAQMQEILVNGARYFCGTCAPGWPLGVYFPQVTGLPAATDGPSWQAAAANLYDNMKVEVFFLAPEAARAEVTGYLQGREQNGSQVLLVGTEAPPAELSAQWVASVRQDPVEPLRQLLPDLLAGKGGTVVDAELALSNVNEEYLTDAKMRLVDELLAEMEAGRIYPFSVPLQ